MLCLEFGLSYISTITQGFVQLVKYIYNGMLYLEVGLSYLCTHGLVQLVKFPLLFEELGCDDDEC